MKKLIKLYSFLTVAQRRDFIKLQLLVSVMSIAEMASVAGIAGFIALLADPSLVIETNILNSLRETLNIENNLQMIIFSGAVVVLILLLSSLISIFTIWKLSIYSQSVGISLGDRLFGYYLTQPWRFHLLVNSSELVKRIATETDRITNGVLNPVMQINSKLILGLFLSAMVIAVDPFIAFIGVASVGLSYFLIYKFVRNILAENGSAISSLLSVRFKIMSNAFGGIRDLLIAHKSKHYLTNFNASGEQFSKRSASSIALAQIPRFLVETLAFILIILLVIYLYLSSEGDLKTILPSIALYAFTGFKLIPCFQQIYSGSAQIRTHISAFDAVKVDLENISRQELDNSSEIAFEAKNMGNDSGSRKSLFESSLRLENINFNYDSTNQTVLKGLNLTIHRNQCIGITGPSGSGKSTLIDIILGLLEVKEGRLYIDGALQNLDYWKEGKWLIGYVPQDIFLVDGSILENIVFGGSITDGARLLVNDLLVKLELGSFLEGLSDGIDTQVGERGVQLSGGQKQKIAIARCLYNQAELIIFDEATSSLDSASESEIMKVIKTLSKRATVILVAHRLSTLIDCDVIYYMENGEIVESGTYANLSTTDTRFRAMLQNSTNIDQDGYL
jgi:ATP-binding cassette, subfamily B, bacterial PglK